MTHLWAAGYDLPPDPPRAVKAPEPPKPVIKGCCRHCGKKIGKGLHFHEKACSK